MITSSILILGLFSYQSLLFLIDFNENLSINNILSYIYDKRNLGVSNRISNVYTDNSIFYFFSSLKDIIIYIFKPLEFNLKSKFILFNSLESLILLILSIYVFSKIRLFYFYKFFKNNSAFYYIYLGSALIPLALTTTNLGIISRHKIMIFGAYYIILTLLLKKSIRK